MRATSLPDIHLNLRSEMKASRLLVGLVLVNLVCITATVAVWAAQPAAAASKLFGALWFVQIILLGGMGVQRLSTSISGERVKKTWDFLRLTPMSSWQIALGKFLGRPLYGYYVAALFLPWFIGIAFFMSSQELVTAAWVLAQSYSLLFFLLAGSFLASASAEERFADRSLSTTLVGTVFVSLFFGMRLFENVGREVVYFGVPTSKPLLWTLSFLVFGVWALFGSKWQIGASLLERPRFYRAPAFLVFVFVYLWGFASQLRDFQIPIWAVTILGYAIVFFSFHDNADALRRWVRTRALDHTPMWILNSVVILLLAVFSYFSVSGIFVARESILALPLFALRDFLILQSCRNSKSHRPEVFALVLIALAHGVPMALLAGFHRNDLYFLATPVGVESLPQLIAPLAEALLMLAYYIRVSRAR